MSENTDSSRREGRGSNRSGASATSAANNSQENFGQQQQPQDFGSWRSTMTGPQASAGVGPEAYSSFYYNGGYSPFPSGDMRDNSLAAIWQRTSPSGEGVAYSGGYGQFPDSSPGQFAANSNPAGQFAANLTGHFASTSELGMFGTPAGDFSVYGQQYGYGPQYTPWQDGSGRGGYSYLGGVQGSEDLRGGGPQGQRDRVNDISHGLETVKLGKGLKGSIGDSNGYQPSQPKKMSWANVASQPAKPQSQPSKPKKPGVLPPPTIIPSKPPVQLAPSTADKMSGPPPMPPQPVPGIETVQPTGPPPLIQTSVPPPTQPPKEGVLQGNSVSPDLTGPPPGPVHNSQGPRAGRATANGVNSGGIGSPASGPTPKSHPVLDNLRSSNEYNPKNFDLNPKNARFFVIKSFSEDDIHRSIKYEIWCSTDHGNKRLDEAFRAQNGIGPIYLLFSVNGSGHFCGMAEMLSPVDYNSTGSVWVQDKFKGQFKVKWIYVKDVPNGQLRHIRLENNENKPVTNSRDTQEVPLDKGKMVLKVIHTYKHATSIFDDFYHYEKRQQEEEENKRVNSTIPGMSLKNDYHGHHQPHHGGPGHRDDYHGGHREGGRHYRGGGHPRDRTGPPPQAARH